MDNTERGMQREAIERLKDERTDVLIGAVRARGYIVLAATEFARMTGEFQEHGQAMPATRASDKMEDHT